MVWPHGDVSTSTAGVGTAAHRVGLEGNVVLLLSRSILSRPWHYSYMSPVFWLQTLLRETGRVRTSWALSRLLRAKKPGDQGAKGALESERCSLTASMAGRDARLRRGRGRGSSTWSRPQ